MSFKRVPLQMGRRVLSSSEIRNRFINFFKSKEHCQIKSSSVRPYGDSTLEFVNAGMNQFKNVFLGLADPSFKRAVNSQKCIRVGGKHNDLDVVGHDSYHHTFFEMLGNWSFNDYFKYEACSYALELITSAPYSLPLERLYFTYFQGDKALNLPPDLETKDIWRQLGVKEDRIIGFGLKDNFWEMGTTGPCGPCTEIHYDHIGSDSRPHLVNKDLPDLTELWNIVFIQFNRKEDGSLAELSQNYVDTGMGLERLVALLQGSLSNYDSDLFTPIFNTIAQHSQVPMYGGRFGKNDANHLDTRYRILADHSRMIAVSLSDSILPDCSHSLRRVIRKSFLVADSLSPGSGFPLLLKTVHSAGVSLKDHFPQIDSNFKQAEMILKDEATLFHEVRKETQSEWKRLLEHDRQLDSLTDCQSVGLIEAYNYLKRNTESTPKSLDTDHALICYDRYGLNISLIEQLANIKGYTINRDEFDNAIGKLKEMNKSLLSNTMKANKSSIDVGMKKTDDKAKFSYCRDLSSGSYSIDKLRSKVIKAWVDNQILKDGQQLLYGSNMSLLLSSTNFHAPLKGCGKTLGQIILTGPSGNQANFTVLETYRLHDWVVHKGFIVPISDRKEESVVYGNWTADCSVNVDSLEGLMRNTTAALLLDFYLKSKYVSVLTFLNSQTDMFTAKFHIYGQPFSVDDALECEESVNQFILDGRDFITETISNKDMLSDPNISIPQHVDPSLKWYQLLTSNETVKFRAVTTSPNVLNSKDLSQVCLTKFHLGKRNRECTICGITGPAIKKDIYESTLELISALQSSTNKIEAANLMKTGKSLLSNNQIPLDLQITLKKTIENVRTPSKPIKIRRH